MSCTVKKTALLIEVKKCLKIMRKKKFIQQIRSEGVKSEGCY